MSEMNVSEKSNAIYLKTLPKLVIYIYSSMDGPMSIRFIFAEEMKPHKTNK